MIVDALADGRVAFRSSAKINLYLEVLGKRADGYHELETVFQEVALFDALTIARRDGSPGVRFRCDVAGLAAPGANLVEKAAAAFAAHTGLDLAVDIDLRKSVPAGSGLGGGSADAAATLAALDLLFATRLPIEQLESLAASLGSDCAFFIRGGAAIGRGRGERLESIDLPQRWLLLILPRVSVATAPVYAGLAADLAARSHVRRIPLAALRSPDAAACSRELYNALENSAFRLHPQLPEVAEAAMRVGIEPVRLTGSGGAMFAVFGERQAAEAAGARLLPELQSRGLGRIEVTHTLTREVSKASGPAHFEKR